MSFLLMIVNVFDWCLYDVKKYFSKGAVREEKSRFPKPKQGTANCKAVDAVIPKSIESRKQFIKLSKLIHPDKNQGCLDYSTELQKILNGLLDQFLKREKEK